MINREGTTPLKRHTNSLQTEDAEHFSSWGKQHQNELSPTPTRTATTLAHCCRIVKDTATMKNSMKIHHMWAVNMVRGRTGLEKGGELQWKKGNLQDTTSHVHWGPFPRNPSSCLLHPFGTFAGSGSIFVILHKSLYLTCMIHDLAVQLESKSVWYQWLGKLSPTLRQVE